VVRKFINKEKGYWQSKDPGHMTSKDLQKLLVDFCKNNAIKSLVDFGCGDASYIRSIRYNVQGIEIIKAFDGNPNVNFISGGLGQQQDLTEPFELDHKFDLVLSLEVAEHIPKKYESIYVDNLVKHCKKHLIMSWAIVGQSGAGHVNCQNNDYVIELFTKLGFSYQKQESLMMRQLIVGNCLYFRNTIMYFKKDC